MHFFLLLSNLYVILHAFDCQMHPPPPLSRALSLSERRLERTALCRDAIDPSALCALMHHVQIVMYSTFRTVTECL